MPSAKGNSIRETAMGWISSLFDVASSQGAFLPITVHATSYHGVTFVLLCVAAPFLLTTPARYQFV